MRVIGQMRAFNQVRSIVAFHIQPLTDFNEYTFHFIEVVHTHLRNTKGAAVSEALAPHSLRAPCAPYPTCATLHARHTPSPARRPPAARQQRLPPLTLTTA